MNKLLSANLARLLRSRVFHISVLAALLLGFVFPVTAYVDMRDSGFVYTLDERFFCFVALIGIIMAVCCSLFVGTEYSDGTIRNKLVVGHTRMTVYLSELAVCMAAGIILCVLSMAASAAAGIPLLGFFKDGPEVVLLLILCTWAVSVAYAALYVMISMICHSRAISAVLCILFAFFLIIASTYIESALNQPETWPAYGYEAETGEIIREGESPNPRYLRGMKRQVYEFLNDFSPAGQSIKIVQDTLEKPWLWIGYDGIIILAATGAGILVFKRKNIK